MKGIIIVVIALFVIAATGKTYGGKNRTDNKSSERPRKNEEGRILILLGNSSRPSKTPSPIIVKRKFCCLCKLPLCICKNCENPESWYVKTHLRAGKKAKTSSPSLKLKSVTATKVKKSPAPQKVPSLSETNRLKGEKLICESKRHREDFKIQSECMKCKLYSNGKSGVLLKCVCCGPIHVNATKRQTHNFSKLVCKLNNKLNIRAKFLEINQ